ncbi:MAG: hypothetical protein NUV64_01160 [Parcubacteria group bacterium]|nr:hypothetical protein [Parcubacteria group bacterium]
MFLFGKKEKIFAVFDIGSGSIGGLLVRDSRKNGIEILVSARSDIKFKEDIDNHLFHRAMEEAFRKTVQSLRSKTREAPDFIFCILSSLLYVSQTRIIKVSREKPFEINKKLLDDLIREETEIFKKTYVKELGSSSLSGEVDPFGHNVMKSVLNGYDTLNPLGKKARQLDLYVYMSMGKAKVKEKIEDIVNESFAGSPIIFSTFPFVIFNILKGLTDNREGFIFVDIAGEVTDISLVKRGVLQETVSFPLGKNFVLRKIGKALNTLIRETASVLSRIERGHSEESATKKISKAMTEAKDEWCDVLKTAVEEIAETSPLPQNLFLVGNDKIVEEFSSCIKDDFFSRFSILGKPFNIKRISHESLDKSFELPSGLKEEKDMFLVLEALFAERFL